jgi:hypothetical protein
MSLYSEWRRQVDDGPCWREMWWVRLTGWFRVKPFQNLGFVQAMFQSLVDIPIPIEIGLHTYTIEFQLQWINKCLIVSAHPFSLFLSQYLCSLLKLTKILSKILWHGLFKKPKLFRQKLPLLWHRKFIFSESLKELFQSNFEPAPSLRSLAVKLL